MKTKLLPLAAILSLATFGAQAHSHVEDSAAIQDNAQGAYVVDSNGNVVRDSWNRCVHSSNWTKETAINKCEGIAEPKPAPVAVVIAPAPKPTPVFVETIIEDVPAAFRGFFDVNKANLKLPANQELDNYADYMTRNPARHIQVTGHTDATGKADYNQSLSQKRANAVKAYLTGKGISGERIETFGMGESAPIATNKTKAGRAENRRVEIKVIKAQ
ncbi:OmpA family protein [Thiomicrorhabdus arctica]|uniref:OmpA family protein n=1 Tax=Thiomicrorhabdus arctica TaxID=131540 RepID=UPI000379B560|nr:OmpA family protein [Thiomicrorhabdus arctica]